jgi:hypothetical protein
MRTDKKKGEMRTDNNKRWGHTQRDEDRLAVRRGSKNKWTSSSVLSWMIEKMRIRGKKRV